jgi:hypothetical protein
LPKTPHFALYEVLPGIDVAFTSHWQLQLGRRASSLTTFQNSGDAMFAWEPKSADESSPDEPTGPDGANLLYRLTIAFPTWAGAIMAVYSVFLCSSSALKIRLK